MIWNIETSHMVAVPTLIEAGSVSELRRRVQEIADSKKVNAKRPPIGKLSFRYELDEAGNTLVVHAHFIGKNGRRLRFMRLRAEQGALTPRPMRRMIRHRSCNHAPTMEKYHE